MFPYITNDELRAHLAKEGINHDAQLSLIRAHVSTAVEIRCGRIFRVAGDETTPQTRRYRVDSQGRIPVRDLIEAFAVRLDSAGTRTFDYTASLGALDFLPDAQENGEPSARYDHIVALPRGGAEGHFSCGAWGEVDGSWGYVETRYGEDGADDVADMPPAGVAFACLLLAARHYKRKDTPLQVAQMPGFGFKRLIEDDKEVQAALAPYVHESKRRVLQ